MSTFIPVNEPLLDGNEKAYLNTCIDTGWISSEGPYVREFEDRLAERVGRRHGIAVANGTAALDVAVAALKIGTGDEVILPSLTIISCAAAVVRAGATPVVVDVDADDWNMDVGQIEKRITPRTKAIMVVHTYGLPVDMAPLISLADKYALALIEDAAEAHGLAYQGRPCGSFGHISTFSFYPNKLLTTGEGGMVLTDDDNLAAACRSLRNLCFQKGKRFYHETLGWNYRLSNLQAAVGVAQLERWEEFVTRKRRIGARYNELLKDIPKIQLPLKKRHGTENMYWVYGLVLDDSVDFDAAEAMQRLAACNVGTRPFFWPIHQQPVLCRMGLFKDESYPVAERLARRGFYIPSGLALTDDQMTRVSRELRSILK